MVLFFWWMVAGGDGRELYSGTGDKVIWGRETGDGRYVASRVSHLLVSQFHVE